MAASLGQLSMELFQPTSANAYAIIILLNDGWLSSMDKPLMKVEIRPPYHRPPLERGLRPRAPD